MIRMTDYHGEIEGRNESLRGDPSDKILDRIKESSDRHAMASLDSFGFGAPPEILGCQNGPTRDVITSHILEYHNKEIRR